ncbi:MAG: hypothetical protein OEX77_10050 [Candidatus Bathyarchaeota archaeon]|nr:hypothetical protein [Candidatus Bathyarchaeota archaeon]
MNTYRLKSSVVMTMLFCLLSTICQLMASHIVVINGLNLDVESETNLLDKPIDVYTQKEPNSGRGRNQPSDAFAPQEEVILYANVTYKHYPMSGKIVAFQVAGQKILPRTFLSVEPPRRTWMAWLM